MPSNWALEGQLNLNKPTFIYLFIYIYIQVLQFFLKISMHISWFIWRHYTQFQKPNVYWMTMRKYCKFAPAWWGFDKILCRYCLKTLSFNNANVKLWRNNRWRFWI
jgi:hypothetical protein